MNFVISEFEKDIVKRFTMSKYPAIYKLDKTDNILFVETVDFDVCTSLLKGEKMSNNQFTKIMNDYQRYLHQIDFESFDEYAMAHYKDLCGIMEIFKKYNS